MGRLLDLVRVVGPRKINEIEILNRRPKGKKETQLYKLYNGLLNGTYPDEEAAAISFYAEGMSETAFSSLKNRLWKRLVQMLFFIENDLFTSRDSAMFNANKHLFCARILSLLNARFAARFFLKKALSIAQEFQITEIALDAARSSRYTSVVYKDKKAYNYYQRLTEKYLELYQLECLADEFDHNISLLLLSSSSNITTELITKAQAYCDQIQEFRKKNDSFELASTYFRLSYRTYFLSRNYLAAVDICQESINYFNENRQITDANRLAEFQFRMLNAYVILRDYDSACQCAIICKANTQEGTYNWYLISFRHIIACIQAVDFHQAFQLFQHAFRNPQFNRLPNSLIAAWKMIEVYLNYIFDSNWANDSSRKVTWFKKKFSLPALLKQAPTLARDKTGSNVALLVVQILYLLEEHDFDQIANRVEALKVYVYRYLNKPDTVRSKLFIKLLLIMDKHGYEYKAVKKATEKTFSKLLEETPDKQPAVENAEIIPFDVLWPRILEKLSEAASSGAAYRKQSME